MESIDAQQNFLFVPKKEKTGTLRPSNMANLKSEAGPFLHDIKTAEALTS
jgi:hypothetical protein